MKPYNTSRCGGIFRVLPAVVVLALTACSKDSDVPAQLRGRTIHAGADRTDAGVFESSAPIQSDEKLTPVTPFDQAKLPSGYDTPYYDRRAHRNLKIVRPLNNASFPRNIAPPELRWEDQLGNRWMLTLRVPGWSEPLCVVTDQLAWRPDSDTWNEIKKSAAGAWVLVEVRGCSVEAGKPVNDEVHVDRTRFKVSTYPADPIIVYRAVTPLFHGYKTPDIYYRDVTTFHRGPFLPGKGQYCTNCHSFPGGPNLDRQQLSLAIAVRDAIVPKTARRLLGMYNLDSHKGKTMNINSFFMSWDPDGTKIAVTRGNLIFSLPLITLETQEFYVLISDIEIVDTETLRAERLPGASHKDYMESFPSWSPDGKTIVFARAPEMDLAKGVPRARFDLYTVPYNNGEGGEPKPVPGASHDGMSSFAPRYSPDGKWIVFTKSDWATLVKPTADLWIVSTKDGAMPRKLECSIDHAMDSHHCWSANSRWLLYASKPEDGIFARIYFTEIDENGHASPPVQLPMLGDTMFCYNVPEFLKCKMPIDGDDILAKTSAQPE